MLRGAKRRGNPFPARRCRADGTSGTPSPTERFDALMRRAGCPHPAARQTKAPAINDGGLRAGRPTRNPAAVRPLLRAGRGSEFHPARGIPKRKTTQRVVFLFGAGDEARTRYLDLGKVALYQMSYARKRKIDYTSHRSVCQPRFPNFRKKLMPALAGGHAGIYRMMISTTPGLSALG